MPYKSAKQRRLMQAVAHNSAFAQKVGIPQSVGQKFEAHKAKGGKVQALIEALKGSPPGSHNYMVHGALTNPSMGIFGENTQNYLDLLGKYGFEHPDNIEDLTKLMDYAEAPPFGRTAGEWGDIGHILNKNAVALPPDLPLFRGVSLMDDAKPLDWKVGQEIKVAPGPLTPVTSNSSQAAGFTELFTHNDPTRNAFLRMLRRDPVRALGVPYSGQDEFLLEPGVARVRDLTQDRGKLNVTVDFKPGSKPKYAKGGKIEALKELLKKQGITEFLSEEGEWFKDHLGNWIPMDDKAKGAQADWGKQLKDEWGNPLSSEENWQPQASKSTWDRFVDSAKLPVGESERPRILRIADNEREDAFKNRQMHGPVSNLVSGHDEFDALQEYQGSGYVDMNRFLRDPSWYGDLPMTGLVDRIGKLDQLLARSSLLTPTRLFRGVGGIKLEDMLGKPDPGFQSWSIDPKIAEKFGSGYNPMHVFHTEAPAGIRGLPLNHTGSSHEAEVLLPREHVMDQAGDIVEDPATGVRYVPVDLRNKYAEGGTVADKKSNYLPELSQVAAMSGAIPNPWRVGDSDNSQQFAEGALSQLYGLDERGEPEFLGGSSFKRWPGIVDDFLSLPTLLPDRFVPEVSKRAAARMDELHSKIRRDMGVAPARGLEANIYNAAGTMAAQLPTGGAKAVETAAMKPGLWRSAGRALSKAGEWFTPTVEAKPSNYLVGAVTGGGLNDEDDTLGIQRALGYGILGGVKGYRALRDLLGNARPVEEVSSPGVMNTYCEGGLAALRTKYAAGGQASGSNDAISAIRSAVAAIQSGDHESALSVLAPHSGNPEIAKVLESLRSTVATQDD